MSLVNHLGSFVLDIMVEEGTKLPIMLRIVSFKISLERLGSFKRWNTRGFNTKFTKSYLVFTSRVQRGSHTTLNHKVRLITNYKVNAGWVTVFTKVSRFRDQLS